MEKLEKIHLEKKGVRAIAVFEAFKGFLAIAAFFGLLSLRHKDLQTTAENLVNSLHLDPTGELAHKFIEGAGNINESNITTVVVLCAVYIIIRFTEAYGLWFLKPWGEWLAIISGALYVPLELYKLVEKPTFTRAVILLFNLAIVGYLFYFRKEQKVEKEIHESLIQSTAPPISE